MIKAEIIADSVNPCGNRLTTFVLTYPRFIHAEFMTHRMISKNSASSRAIPAKKMIQDVIDMPAMPEFWGKNQSGMQAAEEMTPAEVEEVKKVWLEMRDAAIKGTEKLAALGLHKQIANRPLEPWFHMRVIASATDWENFFFLRCHKAAQPEIQALADAMLYQYVNHKPALKQPGEWHLPFTDNLVDEDLTLDTLLKISTARVARVSYLNFEGDSDVAKDIKLHDQLTSSRPGHWSPTEHIAEAQLRPYRCGNFAGWLQYRKTFVEELARGDLNTLLAERVAAGSKFAQG